MFQRKMLCMYFVVVLLAVCASCSAALDLINSVTFTGPIFDKVENGVVLCAQVCPAVSGVPISFHGRTVFGLEFDAGPVYTNSVGKACTVKIVPQGVYEVYAFEGYPFDGNVVRTIVPVPVLRSCPAAVTVWADYANPPANFLSFAEWVGNPAHKATFGAMSIMSPPYGEMSFQLLYLDCCGRVEITAKSFELVGAPGPDTIALYGGCMFENSSTPCTSAHYLLTIQDIGGVPAMGQIKVTDFTGKVLYDSGLHPLACVNYN